MLVRLYARIILPARLHTSILPARFYTPLIKFGENVVAASKPPSIDEPKQRPIADRHGAKELTSDQIELLNSGGLLDAAALKWRTTIIRRQV